MKSVRLCLRYSSVRFKGVTFLREHFVWLSTSPHRHKFTDFEYFFALNTNIVILFLCLHNTKQRCDLLFWQQINNLHGNEVPVKIDTMA